MLKKFICRDRADWLKHRAGIGGSDAAAIVGMDPHRSNVELWRQKTGREKPKDISGLSYVQYGVQAEEHVRELFRLDHPELRVFYEPNNLWLDTDMDFAHASLDGWLEDADGRNGVLEIKTGSALSQISRGRWEAGIPDNYYCQILWYLLVTGWDFVWLRAYLRVRGSTLEMRDYEIERSDPGVEEDIRMLEREGKKFWRAVQEDREPPLKITM